jgi:hypothetical protein
MKHLLVACFFFLFCAPACASTCRVQIATQDAHNSISQGFMAALEGQLRSSTAISIPAPGSAHDYEFLLVRTYPEKRVAPPAKSYFRLFFVLVNAQDKFVAANVLRCSPAGKDCAASVARRLKEACERMPNNSFKPKPLRGSA